MRPGVLLDLAEKIKTSNVQLEESQPAPSPPQSNAFLQQHILEPEETVLVSDIESSEGVLPLNFKQGQDGLATIEEDISESQEPNSTPIQNQTVLAQHPFRPEEAIYVEDIKVIEEKSERREFSPILAQSPTINGGHPTKWKGAMLLASICAVAVSAGIHGYIRS